MRIHFWLSGVLFLAPIAGAYAASIGPVNNLVVFGDSLSDDGNALFLENAYKTIHGSYPTDVTVPIPPNYTTGKFTDGPDTTPAATNGPTGLWIDQFASKMGLAQPQASFLGGSNYATGSAQTGHNAAFPLGVPYLQDQVGLFATANPSGPSADSLYVFWAGADDLFAGGNGTTAANNIAGYISSLHGAGAKYFLWLNLPNLPVLSGSGAFDTQYAADLAGLQSSGIDVVGVDVSALAGAILADPSAYGLTNVTDLAWCGPGHLQDCATNDPNDFLLWDGVHPTTAADALIAQLAYNDVLASSPGASVPEPADAALVLVGILLMWWISRRRRFSSPCRLAADCGLSVPDASAHKSSATGSSSS
ncbi:MAG TPA: SGNH/GDSL hydrolase family protein [Bryobacteraceae bacterium]